MPVGDLPERRRCKPGVATCGAANSSGRRRLHRRGPAAARSTRSQTSTTLPHRVAGSSRRRSPTCRSRCRSRASRMRWRPTSGRPAVSATETDFFYPGIWYRTGGARSGRSSGCACLTAVPTAMQTRRTTPCSWCKGCSSPRRGAVGLPPVAGEARSAAVAGLPAHSGTRVRHLPRRQRRGDLPEQPRRRQRDLSPERRRLRGLRETRTSTSGTSVQAGSAGSSPTSRETRSHRHIRPMETGSSTRRWERDREIYVARSSGQDSVNITNAATNERAPHWKAVPNTNFAYPRPKGATPIRVPLVVAYPQCTSPNRTHGPPLAFPVMCAAGAKLGQRQRRQPAAVPKRRGGEHDGLHPLRRHDRSPWPT